MRENTNQWRDNVRLTPMTMSKLENANDDVNKLVNTNEDVNKLDSEHQWRCK